MKTICRLSDFVVPNVSLYLFSDDTPVSIGTNQTVIGDPENPDLIVLDCNTSNCVLYEGVTNPDDWFGWKYTYTPETDWVLNPDWVDPQIEPTVNPIE